MSDEYDECERCGHDRLPEDMRTIELEDEWYVCAGCIAALEEDIVYRDWQDRYTEEQHERAVSLLSERDEFECIISSYEDGQIVLHTSYVSSDVVTDFCNHFGFQIVSFGPQWENDEMWPCMHQHGSLFEIVLEYNHRSQQPVPLSVTFQENHIERVDGNDKQF